MDSIDVIVYLKDLLLLCLEELKDVGDNPFCDGERTAYVECLEVLQLWKYAKHIGLDFDVEEKYPLDFGWY